MPKITVQVSDKSLDFFNQLMKELKFKIVENSKASAAGDSLADMVMDVPGELILPDSDKKSSKKSKDKEKDKRKKKK